MVVCTYGYAVLSCSLDRDDRNVNEDSMQQKLSNDTRSHNCFASERNAGSVKSRKKRWVFVAGHTDKPGSCSRTNDRDLCARNQSELLCNRKDLRRFPNVNFILPFSRTKRPPRYVRFIVTRPGKTYSRARHVIPKCSHWKKWVLTGPILLDVQVAKRFCVTRKICCVEFVTRKNTFQKRTVIQLYKKEKKRVLAHCNSDPDHIFESSHYKPDFSKIMS